MRRAIVWFDLLSTWMASVKAAGSFSSTPERSANRHPASVFGAGNYVPMARIAMSRCSRKPCTTASPKVAAVWLASRDLE